MRAHDYLWSVNPLYDRARHSFTQADRQTGIQRFYMFSSALQLPHTVHAIISWSNGFCSLTLHTTENTQAVSNPSKNSLVLLTPLATPRPTVEHCCCVDYLWPCFCWVRSTGGVLLCSCVVLIKLLFWNCKPKFLMLYHCTAAVHVVFTHLCTVC